MPAPNPLPTYVYKILDSPPPSPLPAELPPSDLDKQDGFIHLSTAKQIPITASLFFKSHTTLHLVKIHYAPLAAAAKWDDPPNDNDGCPHVYGRSGLAREEIAGVRTFVRGTGQQEEEEGWEAVFAAGDDDGWLE